MTWEAIEEITLESAAASVTFNTGLSGYQFFRVMVMTSRSGGTHNVQYRFNGDSGSTYAYQRVSATSTTVSGVRGTSQTDLTLNPAMSTASNEWGLFSMLIAKPAAGLKAQVVTAGGNDAAPELSLTGAEWANTSDALTSITLFPSSGDFAAGSSFLLEGLAF